MIDRERIKKGKMKARRLIRIEKARWGSPSAAFKDWDLIEKKSFATRVPCSCDMCGNLRKLEGKTIQERRADEAWKSA